MNQFKLGESVVGYIPANPIEWIGVVVEVDFRRCLGWYFPIYGVKNAQGNVRHFHAWDMKRDMFANSL